MKSILYLGIVPFGSIWQRPQQIAAALGERSNVLYVNPPSSPLGALRHRLRPPVLLENDLPKGVRVFQPQPVLPLSGYLPWINTINYASIGRQLRRYLDENAIGEPDLLVASFPKQVDLLRWFPGIPTVYDVMDDYPLFFDSLQASRLRVMHDRLLGRADAVIASSHTLARRIGDVGRKSTVITNGVHQRIIDAIADVEPADQVEKFPPPRFGYIGSVAKWFDFAAVRTLAEAYPRGSVLIVGPNDIALPLMPANVHFLGAKPQRELPSLLRGFDVGIIPFIRSPEIDAVNPVKVYEYFAAGLPVLSSDFSEIHAFRDLVSVCAQTGDWPDQAELTLSQRNNQLLKSRRIQLASQNTWEFKAQAFARVLDALLPVAKKAA